MYRRRLPINRTAHASYSHSFFDSARQVLGVSFAGALLFFAMQMAFVPGAGASVFESLERQGEAMGASLFVELHRVDAPRLTAQGPERLHVARAATTRHG